MQVDPTLMNVGDGGTVSREISAPNKPSATMVGNPPQMLPPEFRGDVTFTQQNKSTPARDCKATKACLDTCNYNHSSELSPPQQLNNAPMPCSALTVTDKRVDKRADVPKPMADSAGVFPAPQWSGGVKVSQQESLNLCHSNMASSKKSNTQSVQSASPGFHCSTMFKPAQSVAFLPSTNFSPLCKITLPPALGQIAALREATASQFQKKIQPKSSGVSGTHFMRNYPYPFSVGRASASEKKAGTSTSKLKSSHLSNKNTKSIEHKSLASVVASPAIALPMQHPSLTSTASTHYTLSPTAAICCGSTLANIASQGRLLNHVDKSSSIVKTTISLPKPIVPSSSDDHTASCSSEPRDVPLDLSAKSKRSKCIKDLPVSPVDPHNDESIQGDFMNSKRTYSTTYGSAVQYPILPNTHRNGAHQKQLSRPQNHQILEPCWAKGSSQDPMKNIPGTYVGVASPILASTLRGKDGKGTFADEFQSFAKQEFISIIDQGEHLATGEKKPSCLMKTNQHAHTVKHVKNTSTNLTMSCPSKVDLTTAQTSSSNIQSHPKSGTAKLAVSISTTVVSPAWQQSSDFAQQHSILQRNITQASPKIKNPPAADGSKNAHYCPSNQEDDKWERIRSPLSNLASIVKQQSFETATLTGEGNAQASHVTSWKTNNLSTFKSNNFDYPPIWSVEKCPTTPSQGDLTETMKRLEKANATEPVGNNTEILGSQAEHAAPQAKQECLTVQSNILGSNASTNGNRMESKLAQVLEGEILKRESGTSDSPPSEKLEGTVGCNVAGQCEAECNKFDKKTNRAKVLSPTKANAVAIKQKKTSPKKPAKEKSPAVPSKKVPESTKKKVDSESTPTKVSPKKKKQCAPVPGKSLLAEKLSLQSKDGVPVEKTSANKVEKSHLNKADSSCSPQNAEGPVKSSKEASGTETTFPRLRRGRRRTDESRLDLWGFATPSPPPPPIPPPPPSPPLTPTEPARRPRGRPRSNPLPERVSHGRGKNTSAEAGCAVNRKRQRCKNKKYQTGDYITDKDKLEDGEHLDESDLLNHDGEITADLQRSPIASSPDPLPQRPSFTRLGSTRSQNSEGSPECADKPSGKRKFKSKHLCVNDELKIKTKRSSLGKRSASQAPDDDCSEAKKAASPPASPKPLPPPPSNKNGTSGKSSSSESPPKKPIPPEVRRLIVNKNAGETLLQRAARLGYQDVVQYCLEKDIREVNRRDNAGYTALHEASSRGWVQIVQMLLKHGADVNCSAQDGTRPIHDAVASDNLPIVWLLLNHGADPTLATYSGQTALKLAHSSGMKTFLTEYFTDLEGRSDHDPALHWDFYSSFLFETDQEPCWDFLLSEQNQELEESSSVKTEGDQGKDCLVFEFSSEPLLPCYHVQVSLTQGFCNWFLLVDVLKRLKMSARIFRARYPHLEVVSLPYAELSKQVSVSQVSTAFASPHKGKNKDTDDDEEENGFVDLVRCVPELQRLLGSSIHILQDDEEEEEQKKETLMNTGKLRSR